MQPQSHESVSANIMSYPELHPVTPPKHKYRTFKIILYGLVLVMIGFFVYSSYIKSPSNLATTQTESANIATETLTDSVNDSYWGQATTPIPTYPPITATTDLSQAASDIEIPDFADQITSLKELITK